MNNLPNIRHLALLCCTVALFALSGCAVPAAAPDSQMTRTETRLLLEDQQRLAERLEQLQTNLVLLEAKVMDQQKLLEALRATPAAPGETPTVKPFIPPSDLTPAELYRQAFAAYAAGRFSEGAENFERFVALFPSSEYIANARFWLAECYLGQDMFSLAAAAFARVADEHRQSAIAPKALWKQALALTRAGDGERAATVLQTLHERYPDSEAAGKPLPVE